jgi:hypothetical protein
VENRRETVKKGKGMRSGVKEEWSRRRVGG